MANHPCEGCPTTADHGVIACPVAGAVLAKGRCRRVKRMPDAPAAANLARVWLNRWHEAKATGDREVIRFLSWQSSSHEGRLASILGELAPADQVRLLASPLVVRVRQSANGADGTEHDPHIDAIVANVVRAWERGNEGTASDEARLDSAQDGPSSTAACGGKPSAERDT